MNSATLTFASAPPADAPAWRRYRGGLISGLLHGAVALLAWNLAGTDPAPKAVASVVELIRVAAPKAIAPPPAPPKPAEPQAKPVSLAPPRPVTASAPQPRTVDAPAASAETYATPAPAAQTTPIGPVTPAAAPAPVAAKAAPAASKVVSTEGIPTDYVNQVYARINRHADYPQAARQRRQQGKVGYLLTLDPRGALLKVEIQPSGVAALDEAAQQAIERAAPFPALPDLGGSLYLLAGNIVFKLN